MCQSYVDLRLPKDSVATLQCLSNNHCPNDQIYTFPPPKNYDHYFVDRLGRLPDDTACLAPTVAVGPC